MKYKRIASVKTADEFRAYLEEIGCELNFDNTPESGPEAPLAREWKLQDGQVIGNRFCVLPMEGWDGMPDGKSTEHTLRRWRRFGASGSKLIWGGEAVAVRHEGRANPNQLMINEENLPDLENLRRALVLEHADRYDSIDDLYVGLQLTHSGRFCRPNIKTKLEPKILYHHPVLDDLFNTDPGLPVITDDDIRNLIDDYIAAASLAYKAGFQFVDIKHCHGYLGHEFLSAFEREGDFGGSFENRTRFLREITAGIKTEVPDLQVGVRFSAFDFTPFRPGDDGIGVPACSSSEYPWAFGGDGTGTGIDLTEPKRLLDVMKELGIEMVCITGGSPYYNPHIQRPALFPPSDGYQPPEDPLMGVARQIKVTEALKKHGKDMLIVSSALSYLQEWLPNVGQYMVREKQADFIGLGRMVLPYPEIAADILEGRELQRKKICRTFSDCTTAPRNGIISGCFPLDEYYKKLPEAEELKGLKKPGS